MDSPADDGFFQAVAALKHDLAKYVAWRSANLAPEIWEGEPGGELLEALRADLLHTRQQTGRTLAAWQVFEVFEATCAADPEIDRRAQAAPELASVRDAVAVLRGAQDVLRAGDLAGLASMRLHIRDAQQQIRESLRALHRRLRQEAG